MSLPRKPGAFSLPDQPAPVEATRPVRRPAAFASDDPGLATSGADPFELEAVPDELLAPPPLSSGRRRRLWPIVAGALGVLVSLSVGLWTQRLIEDLFSRSDWIGWVAVATAAVGLLALAAIILREVAGLMRLGSIEHIRQAAAEAAASSDPAAARAVGGRLVALMAARPETAAGRRAFAAHDGEIVDGSDLLRIAEIDLLGPLDAQARSLILDAAKRVSVVTAVSPRAIVDLAYVAFEAGRLVRRIAELYGGRPGTLGFLRLARATLGHLAVTGAIAAGDDLVHQLVGQGLAARLSARLGEGVVNGMMTARIGLAAMDVARPLPFSALPRPRIGDFLRLLTRFSEARAKG